MNSYREPNFLLTRAQDGIWRRNHHHEILTGAYPTAWCLCEWLPRDDWGNPNDWPGEIYGRYPTEGRYNILQPFPNQRLDTLYLNSRVVRYIVWIAREHRHDNLATRVRALRDADARTDQDRENRIADMLHDAYPSFTGAASFANSPTTRTAVQNKLALLEAKEQRGELAQPRRRGMIQGES
ncbi:MAG: hypothetical protein ACRD22_03335 [Terriglobia bacterium]